MESSTSGEIQENLDRIVQWTDKWLLTLNAEKYTVWGDQISKIVRKANSLIYRIRKSFRFMTSSLFVKVFTVYIRPTLEFGYQIWSSYLKKEIDMLQKAERRATKIPTGMKDQPYEKSLPDEVAYVKKS